MKNITPAFRRGMVALLLLSLLFSFATPRAVAQNNSQISVQVGQPNIWSLGQAHYLLSAMRDRSRGIGVQVPIPQELNPNSANGARLDVLRTLFSAGAEVNTAIGTQNRLNRQKFDAEFARYQAAQSRIDEILTPYTQAVSEVSSLKIQLDALPADEANKEARKKLTEQIAQRTAERDALKAELDELRRTQAATTLALTSPSPPGAITTNTPPDDLASVFQAIVKGTEVPKLNASTVLDNYILMQYEVIAKQLTLLRDEIGPDQRLVFLELPMSVYSVPERDEEYVVQTQWNVTQFLGLRERERRRGERYGEEGFVGEPININVRNADLRDILNYIKEQHDINFLIDESVPEVPITAQMQDVPWNQVLDSILAANGLRVQVRGNILRVATLETLAREDDDNCGGSQSVPITFELINSPERITRARAEDPCQSEDLERLNWIDATPNRFRVVDIIPRQSALNVNDVHGTQKGLALTAKFLSFAGLGAQVGYQRQRSIYEQFLQQEVYASAFGKGLSTFGVDVWSITGDKAVGPRCADDVCDSRYSERCARPGTQGGRQGLQTPSLA